MRKVTTFCLALCATTALWAAFTPAVFTVSADGKQVYFSRGNLQCSGVTTGEYVWAFADNQYDMLGTANVSSDGALADKIDLFGWSGNNKTAKWGISLSTTTSDYAGDFVDWGANTIGTNAPNTYRTLTYSEWEYLLNMRTNASEKKSIACIKLTETETVNGLVLLPDSWALPEGASFKNGFSSEEGVEAYAAY